MWHPDGHGRHLTDLGDSRERSVACVHCTKQTWAMDSVCDACHDRVCQCELDGDSIPMCRPEANAESWDVA